MEKNAQKQAHEMLMNLKPEFKLFYFWLMFRIFCAEFMASAMFNMPAMLVCKSSAAADTMSGALVVSISTGAAIYIAIWILYPASGSHINPIISLATAITRRLPFVYLPLYWIAQLCGAFFALLLRKAILPRNLIDKCPLQLYIENDHVVQGFFLEAATSFTIVVVYLCTIDDSRSDNWGLASGVNMALSLMLCCTANMLIADSTTGGLMNPFKGLVIAIHANDYHLLWVFMTGPIAGCFLGIVMHKVFLTPTSPLLKTIDHSEFLPPANNFANND